MARVIWRAALLGVVLLAALFTLAQAGRAGEDRLRSLFSAGCPTENEQSCFIGIRVGETSLADARAALDDHPWIADVDERMTMDYFGVEHLRFRWRDPLAADPVIWHGELISSYNVVTIVRLEPRLTLGDIWYALGEPPIIAFSGTPSRRAPTILLYSTFFADNSAAAASTIVCPLSFRSFLLGEVTMVELRKESIAALPARNLSSPLMLLQALRASRPMC